MQIHLREGLTDPEREAVLTGARAAGFLPQVAGPRVIVLIGHGDAARLTGHPGIERIVRTAETPPLVARGPRRGTTEVRVGPVVFGRDFVVAAGPCAVEDPGLLLEIAHAVKAAGADLLRGGAYKPRTSPYSFQGMGAAGLDALRAAREATGLPVVTEALDCTEVMAVAEVADMIQVGTRNMMNYTLLRRVARAERPVLLKRGMGATIGEWLDAAEHLLVGGCPGVVLCERGIRTFSERTRFTLDLAAVPVVRADSHLPVIVDPSHASGDAGLVPALARAAAAAGAHGVMVEVHPRPAEALCDSEQALRPERLAALVAGLRRMAALAAEEEAKESRP